MISLREKSAKSVFGTFKPTRENRDDTDDDITFETKSLHGV